VSTEAAHERRPGPGESGDERELAFFVNDERIVVYTAELTVREILDDAGFGVATHVLVKRSEDGSEAVYADPDEALHLVEDVRFHTRPRVYHIKVNGRARTTETNPLTYNDVVKLSELPPPTDGVEYLVTFSDAEKPPDGDLIEGESVEIKDGTYFVVTPSNRS
jgi:hypothetical protein